MSELIRISNAKELIYKKPKRKGWLIGTSANRAIFDIEKVDCATQKSLKYKQLSLLALNL